jgi:hypothetical protein
LRMVKATPNHRLELPDQQCGSQFSLPNGSSPGHCSISVYTPEMF